MSIKVEHEFSVVIDLVCDECGEFLKTRKQEGELPGKDGKFYKKIEVEPCESCFKSEEDVLMESAWKLYKHFNKTFEEEHE